MTKIVFEGTGPLLGPLINDTFQAFPMAKLYDRTPQFMEAVKQEQGLVDKGYIDRRTIPRSGRVYDPSHSANPDLRIICEPGRVKLSAWGTTESIEVPVFKTLEEMDAFIAQVIEKMKEMMRHDKHGHKSGKTPKKPLPQEAPQPTPHITVTRPRPLVS